MRISNDKTSSIEEFCFENFKWKASLFLSYLWGLCGWCLVHEGIQSREWSVWYTDIPHSHQTLQNHGESGPNIHLGRIQDYHMILMTSHMTSHMTTVNWPAIHSMKMLMCPSCWVAPRQRTMLGWLIRPSMATSSLSLDNSSSSCDFVFLT